MKKALIIISMIAIIAIAGSMIYYFVFFRTGQEKAEIRLQEQKLEMEREKAEKATEDSLENKAALAKCLDDANKRYSEAQTSIWDAYTKSWNLECERLGLKPNSPLPNNIADYLNKDRDDALARAYKQYESDQDNCRIMFQN